MSRRVERGGGVLICIFINFGQTAAFERRIFQFLKRVNELHTFCDSSPSGLILKRSRSLPQEEFVYLTQKLRELDLIQRTDSIISGHSAR